MHRLELRYKKCSFYVLPAIGCRCGSPSNTFFCLHIIVWFQCIVQLIVPWPKQLTVIWETGNKMKICNLRSEFQSLHEYESRH